MKIYEGQFYQMYIDPESTYSKRKFFQYTKLLDGKNSSILMKWVTNEKIGVSHITFDHGDTTIWTHYNDLITGNEVFVN